MLLSKQFSQEQSMIYPPESILHVAIILY